MTGRAVVSTPGTCGGRPRIEGTRVPVERIVEAFNGGWSPAKVAEQYSLEIADVHNALRFQLRLVEARRNHRRRPTKLAAL